MNAPRWGRFVRASSPKRRSSLPRVSEGTQHVLTRSPAVGVHSPLLSCERASCRGSPTEPRFNLLLFAGPGRRGNQIVSDAKRVSAVVLGEMIAKASFGGLMIS